MNTAGDITPHMFGKKRVTVVDRGTAISGTIRRTDYSVRETKSFFGEVVRRTPVVALTIGQYVVKNIPLGHPVIIKDRDD